MKDLYHLVTLADGQKDSYAIVNVLQNIHDGKLKNDLRLLNYIREVPVSFKPTLEKVAEDSVELTVHHNQVTMMKHDKYTLIQSSHFPHDFGVHAYVALASPPKGAAILVRFAYAQIRAERRNTVRVQLHQEIPATFTGPSGTISGSMIDISIGGISLKVKGKIKEELEAAGHLTCMLPNGLIEVPARLFKSVATEEENKAVFVIETSNRTESLISQFIFNEQVEIIKELKDRHV